MADNATEIELVLEPLDEGGYHVYAPDLPGLHTQGDDLDDAMTNAPSLPTSRETPMIRELLNPEGANGARDVVDEQERSRRPRNAASRRRAQ